MTAALLTGSALAQQVTLPLPRLLTINPMGAQAGKTLEVSITGENLEDIQSLQFSEPRITAKALGNNKFEVQVPADLAPAVHDARIVCRLGLSSPRAFCVGNLPELQRSKPNTSLATAMDLPIGSLVNASMSKRSVDYYRIEAKSGQRLLIECQATGIDSRLMPVLALADARGADIKVNRTTGLMEHVVDKDGPLVLKLNDLTFQGGERHYYRLAVREIAKDAIVSHLPRTRRVSAMSWPPVGLAAEPAMQEKEPNNQAAQIQKISLPCDIGGSFFPAADQDLFEFQARKGEVWWVEVASERLGLNTDPFVLVQQVSMKDGKRVLSDVAELYDIAPPLKPTSNGYSYDGPVYDAGSADINGKFEIKADGTYQLQIRDLFGGTRNEPGNRYRLIVRKAQPDFSLAAWGLHMTLRNGDRSALSKPMTLRAGDSRAFEVAVVRRDGFDGEIEILMDNLPAGVQAKGLKIGKGKSVGHLILSSAKDAKPGWTLANLRGRAVIDGKPIERRVAMAGVQWPVRDAKGELPAPRLLADVPVSVSNSEPAPVTLATAQPSFEAKVGGKVDIPLQLTWNNEFNGSSLRVKAYGEGVSALKEFEIPLNAKEHKLSLNLAELKLPAGVYTFALQTIGISRYRYNPAAVPLAEAEQKKAQEQAALAAAEAKKIAATDAAAAKRAAEKQKQAEAAMAAASSRMKAVSSAANPTDTVDIFFSQPIELRVIADGSTASTKAP